jgi:hypothetical protein
MHRMLLIGGLLALAAVWLTALPQMARQAFWAHDNAHGRGGRGRPAYCAGSGGHKL